MRIVRLFLYVILVFVIFSPISSNIKSQNYGTTHVIEIHDNYFSKTSLEIEIGDSVKFEWMPGAIGHNVVQTESSNSLSKKEGGFSSGDPASAPFTYTIPAEFMMENVTLYFICEPHASSGMRGEIIVGSGSDEVESNFSSIMIGLSFMIIVRIHRTNVSFHESH